MAQANQSVKLNLGTGVGGVPAVRSLQLVCKTMGDDEEMIGCISFDINNYFSHGVEGKWAQWITLFDDINDDDFDGTLGENDEEIPRVYVEFKLDEKADPTPKTTKRAKTSQLASDPSMTSLGRAGSGRAGSGRGADSSIPRTQTTKQDKPLTQDQYRKEKVQEMAKLDGEIKKYDLDDFKSDAIVKTATIAQSLKTIQQNIQFDERANTKHLNKIGAMQQYLEEDAQTVQASNEATIKIQERAQANFDNAQKESDEEQRKLEDQLLSLEKQLNSMKSELSTQKNENSKLKKEVESNRKADTQNTYPEFDKYSKQVQENSSKISNLQKEELQLLKTKEQSQLKFEDLSQQFSQNIDSNLGVMTETEQNRDKIAHRMVNSENQLEDAIAENLRLKNLSFDLDFKVNHCHLIVSQTQSKLRTISDKHQKVQKELEMGSSIQEKEFKKVAQELESSKRELERLKVETSANEKEMTKISSQNEKEKSKKFDIQLEDLTRLYRNAEAARKEAQFRLESQTTTFKVEMSAYTKDSSEVKQFMDESDRQVRSLIDKYEQLCKEEASLLDKKERANKRLMENQERDDLMAAYVKETADYEQMIDDAIRQKEDIAAEIERTSHALQERQARMQDQTNLLNQLKKEKQEYKKELEKLYYKVKDLNKHIIKYNQEIERLSEEKENLNKKVNELDMLVRKRDEDIGELELVLKDREKTIQTLENRLQIKKPAAQPLPRGDLLDELLGNYINQMDCPVPIKKLGNGYYIFGTRKIYAKILNGKLVIRVGGGYMVIEEFISTYADQELNKINKMQQKADEMNAEDAESLDLTPASRGASRKGFGSRQNVKSPRATMQNNFAAAVSSDISGTNRQRKMTKAQIDRIQNDPRAGRYLEDKVEIGK